MSSFGAADLAIPPTAVASVATELNVSGILESGFFPPAVLNPPLSVFDRSAEPYPELNETPFLVSGTAMIVAVLTQSAPVEMNRYGFGS